MLYLPILLTKLTKTNKSSPLTIRNYAHDFRIKAYRLSQTTQEVNTLASRVPDYKQMWSFPLAINKKLSFVLYYKKILTILPTQIYELQVFITLQRRKSSDAFMYY
jgi:hypothetical protein